MKRKNNKRSRFARIEMKCDRIISELGHIQRLMNRRSRPMDDIIDTMHHQANRMRRVAINDRNFIRSLFNSKNDGTK